jgi:hypothetical protein
MAIHHGQLDESQRPNEVRTTVSAWFKSVPIHSFCREQLRERQDRDAELI